MGAQNVFKEFLKTYQRPSVYFTIAGVSGALAVALGAYGSHDPVLNLPENAKYKKIFEIANRYHMLHTIVLLSVPLLKRPNLVGPLLISGQALFCGSCYIVGFSQNMAFSKVAPVGAITLIGAWLAMAF